MREAERADTKPLLKIVQSGDIISFPSSDITAIRKINAADRIRLKKLQQRERKLIEKGYSDVITVSEYSMTEQELKTGLPTEHIIFQHENDESRAARWKPLCEEENRLRKEAENAGLPEPVFPPHEEPILQYPDFAEFHYG